jgi:hypothetical protein
VNVLGEAPAALKQGNNGAGISAQALAAEYGGKWGKRAVMAAALTQMAWPAVKAAQQWYRNRGGYYVLSIQGEDPLYADVHAWVLSQMPDMNRRLMQASTVIEYDGDDNEVPTIQLGFDGGVEQTITIAGHPVVVKVSREALPDRISVSSDNWRLSMEKILFTVQTTQARQSVVEALESLAQEKYANDEPPALMMPSRWGGGWQKRDDLPTRGLDSVVLKAGQLERIRDDLDDFLASEERYVRMSQPWHRGYLWHGPPGTGKTSLARALATEFGLPTYYLPLGDIAKDSDLMQLVSGIKPRSVLLLEDVDSFHAATSRADEKDHASVATLLNALDGVWTPHGLITMMTTNNRGALDPALIRAGRVDVDEELSVLDEDQATRLVERLSPGGLPGDSPKPGAFEGLAPAELIEHIRNNT